MSGQPSDNNLIVLRGNSASGKTTIASTLQQAMGPRTANIGQDHFRRVVLREHELPGGDNIGLIAHTIRYCASIGYHVIVEGMFRASRYTDMLSEVLAEHPGPTHLFYLDVSLNETQRRHGTRAIAADVPVERLREWYLPLDLLSLPGEILLDGMHDVNATTQAILDEVGPLPARPPGTRDRFF